jgi:membrane-associated phospholipid phosphatase
MVMDVKPLHCSKEFGNPSGHSSGALLFSITLFIDQVYVGRMPIWVKVILTILLIMWATIIPFTRVLMGVHSID